MALSLPLAYNTSIMLFSRKTGIFLSFFAVFLAFVFLGTAYASDFSPRANVRDYLSPPGEYEGVLRAQVENMTLGPFLIQPLRHAVKYAVLSGVSVETVVLILLLPIVGSLIAAFRHLIGLRGFGIFLPAAVSVVFLAIGPVVGFCLFLLIVSISTAFRFLVRKLKFHLQYLPRMSLTLSFVSMGVLIALLAAPYFPNIGIPEVSIFPVLIMVLLSEDFTKVQQGKSARVAVILASETLILALMCYTVLALKSVQIFAVENPGFILAGPVLFDLFLGRYTGLRLLELWRFRKLITK